MRRSEFWKWRPCDAAVLKKWCCRAFACGALLALFALTASVATSERRYGDEPAVTSSIANVYSGAGNLVPVF